MPSGVVKWYDPATGEGIIEASGHEYPVKAEDIDRHARVPQARVTFKVRRDGGVKRAVDVKLREGTRSSRRQGRFGDLAGAHHPDEKGRRPLTRSNDTVDWALEDHPRAVARAWLELLEKKDLGTVMSLYAPDAVLHTDDGTVTGRRAIEPVLVDRGLVGMHAHDVEERGSDEIVVRWTRHLDGEEPMETRMRVAHGKIAEQWL